MGFLQTDYLTVDPKLPSYGTQALLTLVSLYHDSAIILVAAVGERNHITWKLSDCSLLCSVQVTTAT